MKKTKITQNWMTVVGFKGEKENGFICPEGKEYVCTDYVEVRIDPKEGSPLFGLIEYTEKDWKEDYPDAVPFIEKDGSHKGNFIVKGAEWTMDETIDRIVGYIHFVHDTLDLCFTSFEVGSVNSREDCDVKKLLIDEEFDEIISFAKECIKTDFAKETKFAAWMYSEDAEEMGVVDVEENTRRLSAETHVKMVTKNYDFEETCPHCDHVNEVKWDKKSHSIICSGCGKRILLCNLCNMDEQLCGKCPYEKELHEEDDEEEITYYVACFERYLTVKVKRGQKELAKKIMEDAYNTWHEYPDDVGDECCEEYICGKLIQYGIIQGLECCTFE